jgi:hypothetical protein
MAKLDRPPKQGNTTTYQAKVAAGYTKILAAEVDADLDLIYAAWNQGVDSVNIQPGVITGDKLAPGAVGTRELQDGGVATVDLADAAVTTPKIADGAVTAGKLVGGGVMGGDFTGSYPNPSLGVVHGGRINIANRATLLAAIAYAEVQGNEPSTIAYINTDPTWLIRIAYDSAIDEFQVFHAPAPGTSFTKLFSVHGSDGKTYCTLADSSVLRGQIAVNAIFGNPVSVPAPASFSLSTGNVWTQYAGNVALTTRGGYVSLCANTDLSVGGPGVAGGLVYQRWLRDGAVVIQQRGFLVSVAQGTYIPLPGINCLDYAAAAGAHTYVYQVYIGANMTVLGTSQSGNGFLEAVEIG